MTTPALDRTAFKAQTAEEAANHKQFYKNLNWKKRLEIAAYLNSVAYNYSISNPPKLDKTKFIARSRTNGEYF